MADLGDLCIAGAMPRYFFNVYNDETSLDEEGSDFPDLAAARAHAIAGARSLMSDTLKEGRIDLSHHIAIVDEDGRLLADVAFGDAVEVRP
jgi:hypothetical protein